MGGGLWIDIIVAVLLVITITYCALLMKKLNNLRSAQSELRGIIKGFGDAIAKAEQGVIELRKAGDEAATALDEKISSRNRDLGKQIAKATELANDLEFMSDAGNKLADRLEAAISGARVASSSKLDVSASVPSGPSNIAEEALVEKSAPRKPEATSVSGRPGVSSSRDSNDTQAKRSAPVRQEDDWDDFGEDADDPEMMDELGARSEVERDLLQALRQSK